MRHVRTVIAAGAIVVAGALGGGAGGAAATPAASATTSGSDLNADLHQAGVSEHATANDLESAAEDVDNGQVSNVDSQDNESGTVETGTTNDVAESTDSHDSTGE